MKKLNCLFVVMAILLWTGCQKDSAGLLDKEETNDIYPEMVFTNPEYAVWFLNGLYGNMNAAFFRFGDAGFLANGVDEGQPKANWDKAHLMAIGSWGPASNPLNVDPWKVNYTAIRAANLFLANVDAIPDATEPLVNGAVRERMKGEAIFLRAFYYADLMKYYGGVPVITEVLTQNQDEELFKPREKYDECVEFVVSEIERALPLLPEASEVSDAEYGRVTKGAALALLSRIKLFAASPLFNDAANPQNSEFRGQYNENKWAEAAEAALRFMKEAHGYALHNSTSLNKYGNNEDFFIRRSSPEVILSYHTKRSDGSADVNLERNCLPGQFFNYGNGVINNLPVLNLIADYEVVKVDNAGNVTAAYELGIDKVLELYKNGAKDPVSDWDPQNPYANRDPRFYQNTFYNQSPWPARANSIYDIWQRDPGSGLVVDGPQYLVGNYNTGFYNRKFLDAYANQKAWGTKLNVNHNYPILRYAEILLNYAEAVNEAYGSEVAPPGGTLTARDAVNQIRARAVFPSYTASVPPGMPLKAKGKSMPPLPSGLNKEDMRHKIQHERRIEFAFEEQRYFDVRRWKIGKQTEKIYSQRIYKKQDGTFRYDAELLEIRPWNDKYNLFPMWESELQKNKDLVQNPGWGSF